MSNDNEMNPPPPHKKPEAAPYDRKKKMRPTAAEIVAKIQEMAGKLGRPPKLTEVQKELPVLPLRIQRMFGNYAGALKEAGLEPKGTGHRADMVTLFADWATVVRKLGKAPTVNEYERLAKFTSSPLQKRFGGWCNVAAGLLRYAEQSDQKNDGKNEWEDVLEVVRRHLRGAAGVGVPLYTNSTSSGARPRILPDRPIYGDCLLAGAMAFAPENEQGVVSLFSAQATKLGFIIIWMGTTFPDCEAFRQVEPGRWQRVWIEFEFQSRNFLAHRHDPAKCDLIVCWENNWPESPLEVLELKQAVSTQQSALRQS